jgi:peptide/nickel transport system ATP-binding protein
MVFQDPYGSLNPARTIEQSLIEPLIVHRSMSRSEMAGSVERMLADVGLPPEAAGRYPALFSGGQRQRIALARALMIEPELIVCDEAVSALDLSVQAQVLNLLAELQRKRGLAYLFISHDLAVVRLVAHRVVVLYRGHVMELGPVADVCSRPQHPYTRALLAAAPVPDPVHQRNRRELRKEFAQQEAAPMADATAGCPFAGRCPYVIPRCHDELPALRETDRSIAACHRIDDLPAFSVTQ